MSTNGFDPWAEGMTDEQIMDLLSDVAVAHAPRLFSLYGLPKDGEHEVIIGWGMDFGEQAVFYLPDSRTKWISQSAESLLQRYSSIGNVRLTWLSPGPVTD